MNEKPPRCVVCERTKNEVPLITVNYKEDSYYICPQHLPVLIHNPEELTGKLPGAENLTGHNH
jgi:hypothetical protein